MSATCTSGDCCSWSASHDAFANLRLAGVTAECIERGQTDVDAVVVAQRVQQGRLHLRIEMSFAAAPAHALQALAGGLLLQHRERDELAHVGQLGVHGGNFVGVCGETSAWRVVGRACRRMTPMSEKSGAPGDGAERRTEPREEAPRWCRLPELRVISVGRPAAFGSLAVWIGMQHGFKAGAGVRTGLIGWKKGELLPHGDVLRAVRTALAVLLDLARLARAVRLPCR